MAFCTSKSRAAIACRIVKIGDTAGRKAPDDPRVIRLPTLIVALGNHGIAERVEKPRPSATGSFVKITWILFQKGWQYSASDEGTRKNVSIGGTIAFGITLCTLPVFIEIICRLLNSRKHSNCHEGEGIDD